MKVKKIAFLLVSSIIIVFFLLTYKGTKADDAYTFTILNGEENRAKAQQAIVNSAFAFYYHNPSIQYNNHSVYYTGKSQLNTSYDFVPEHINPQNVQYNDCGHFIENIYAETFVTSDTMPYYISAPLDDDLKVFQYSIDMHSNGAMYNEARKLDYTSNLKCVKDSNNNCVENEYYEVIDNSKTGVGIYYYLNKTYLDDVKNHDPKNAETGLISDHIDKYALGEETQQAILENIENVLQLGDVITYSRLTIKNSSVDASGHVLVCVGLNNSGKCNKFMHSSGGSYNFTTKSNGNEANGAIKYTSAHISNPSNKAYGGILDYCKDSTNYSKEDGGISCVWPVLRSNTYQIAIIRPINHVLNSNTYGFSKIANIRTEYPKLVSMKMASVNKYESVNPGDNITYTIKLENKSDIEYKNVIVTDKIPTYTTYVSHSDGGNLSGNDLSWTVNVPAKGETIVTYTVNVKNDAIGKTIKNDKTIVAGILMNGIETAVKKTLTKPMQNKLINEVNKKINDETYHPENTRTLIRDIYKIIFNCDNECNDLNFTNISAKNMMNAFYTVSNSSYTLNTNNDYKDMYVDNLFGGYHVSDGNLSNYFVDDDREMYFDNDTLMVGDVVLLVDSNYENELDSIQVAGDIDMYLYLGNGEFAMVPRYKYDDDKVTVKLISSNKRRVIKTSRVLDSLIGQDAFVVLRPSYVISKNISNDEELNFGDLVVDMSKKIIKDIKIGTKYNTILDKITTTGKISLISNDGNEINGTSKVKSGDKIIFVLGDEVNIYMISVRGDLTGDEDIKINDVSKLYRYVKGKENLADFYIYASDVTNDGEIKINDVSKLYRYVKGKITSLE